MISKDRKKHTQGLTNSLSGIYLEYKRHTRGLVKAWVYECMPEPPTGGEAHTDLLHDDFFTPYF